jgi:hypothetical protein
MFNLSADDFKDLEPTQVDYLVGEISRSVREQCAKEGTAVIAGLLEELREGLEHDPESVKFFDRLLRKVAWPSGYVFRGLYPPDPSCPDCHGKGYVMLLVSRQACKACKKFP